MEALPDKAALIRRHAFFREMPPSTIQRFAARARIRSFATGTPIFRKGDEGSGLIAVVSGLVRISVTSDNDTELTLNMVGPGEVFGEISLLDGMPRTAHATVAKPCRLLHLERRDFLATLLDEPLAALTLLKVISLRLRQTSRQLEQASFGHMSSQLAQMLIALDKRAAADSAADPVIRMSQKALGNMIGLSRESTNRYLRAWHHQGFITIDRGRLTVRDGGALAKLAAS